MASVTCSTAVGWLLLQGGRRPLPRLPCCHGPRTDAALQALEQRRLLLALHVLALQRHIVALPAWHRQASGPLQPALCARERSGCTPHVPPSCHRCSPAAAAAPQQLLLQWVVRLAAAQRAVQLARIATVGRGRAVRTAGSAVAVRPRSGAQFVRTLRAMCARPRSVLVHATHRYKLLRFLCRRLVMRKGLSRVDRASPRGAPGSRVRKVGEVLRVAAWQAGRAAPVRGRHVRAPQRSQTGARAAAAVAALPRAALVGTHDNALVWPSARCCTCGHTSGSVSPGCPCSWPAGHV